MSSAQSDDIAMSSSQSFAEDSVQEKIDRRLERENLKDDLYHGGLDAQMEELEADDPELDAQFQQKAINAQFARDTKFTGPALSTEAAKAKAEEEVQLLKRDLAQAGIARAQQAKQPMKIGGPRKRQELEQQKQLAKLAADRNKQEQIEQQNVSLKKQLEMEKQKVEKIKIQLENANFADKKALLATLDEQPMLQMEQQVAESKFQTFQREQEAAAAMPLFQKLDQDQDQEFIKLAQSEIQIVDGNEVISTMNNESKYQQIGSIHSDKLTVFAVNIEAHHKDEGKAILWGKVLTYGENQSLTGYDPDRSSLQSCCVLLNGLERQLYILPTVPLENIEVSDDPQQWNQIFADNGQVIQKNERGIMFDDKISEASINKGAFTEVRSRIGSQIMKSFALASLSNIKLMPVWRIYQFNDLNIDRKPRIWLKLRLPGSLNIKNLMLNPDDCKHVIGASVRPIDLWLAENQISGMSWLQISGFQAEAYRLRCKKIQEMEEVSKGCFRSQINTDNFAQFYSGSYHEFVVDFTQVVKEGLIQPKVIPLPLNRQPALPPLSSMQITARSLPDPVTNQEAAVLYSVAFQRRDYLNKLNEDESTMKYFIIGRRVDNQRPFVSSTVNFQLKQLCFEDMNKDKNVNVIVIATDKEPQLLLELFKLIEQLNPDVIVMHDIYSQMFTAIKRLVSILPWHIISKEYLFNASRSFGRAVSEIPFKSKESFDAVRAINAVFQGRVVCDLDKMIQEFSPDNKLSSIEYTINVLVDQEIVLTPSVFFTEKYKKSDIFKNQLMPELLRELLAACKITRELSVLQLTAKISHVTNYQIQNVMSLGRAKRVEFLLLFNFVRLPFIIPDYVTNYSEETGAKYVGGYVIDPEPGFYDSVIFVLDFNSLYPSIIREYNVCFTTVPPFVPDDDFYIETEKLSQFVFSCQLPRIIGDIVEERLQVKKEIKLLQTKLKTSEEKEKQVLNLELQSLDIKQLALKLCANSMYGSLGYERGRFYCPKVAASIPNKGRAELQNAVFVAKNNGYQVIYGDTDSIMINSKLQLQDLSRETYGGDHISQAARKQIEVITKNVTDIANKLGAEIGEGKKYLEMGLDYIFVKQLLLAKKKYAALKLKGNQLVLEVRGLDMVRRDWCNISRDLSKQILEHLMWYTKEQGIERTIQTLNFIRQSVEGKEKVFKYVQFMMTKSISKPLKQYTGKLDESPHVYVAKLLESRGKVIKPGFVVEYLILNNEAALYLLGAENRLDETSKVLPIYKRCIPFEDYRKYFLNRHPVEVLDISWYMTSQILPPLERLCASVQELDRNTLASSLGIENKQEYYEQNQSQQQSSGLSFRDQFNGCAVFVYRCPKCQEIKCWPEAKLTADDEIIPAVNLDFPSCTFRGSKANETGQPLLSQRDLTKTSCGHQFDPIACLKSLKQQLDFYERIYFCNGHMCEIQSCRYFCDSMIRQQILRGRLDLNISDIMTRQLTWHNNIQYFNCIGEGCTKSQLHSLYPFSQFKRQLLFFVHLFDRDSLLYMGKINVDRDIYILNEAQSMLLGWLEQRGYLQVDLSSELASAFRK